MHNYFFFDTRYYQDKAVPKHEIQAILSRVAESTDTRELVVSIYFMGPSNWSGGTAYVRKWMQPQDFRTSRGKWNFTHRFSLPKDLPSRFKLIRILAKPLHERAYPQKLRDGYGWEFCYHSFSDHLALVFEHELHHFRRYHLGFHSGEGERSANRWALGHVTQLGFKVQGQRIKVSTPPVHSLRTIFKKILPDPFSEFRNLVPGTQVIIRHDPAGRYSQTLAEVMRPIRANSKRMVIRTQDKKMWRWPMEWLRLYSK